MILGEQYPLKKMFELREDNPEKCILIGTLFKHQVIYVYFSDTIVDLSCTN